METPVGAGKFPQPREEVPMPMTRWLTTTLGTCLKVAPSFHRSLLKRASSSERERPFDIHHRGLALRRAGDQSSLMLTYTDGNNIQTVFQRRDKMKSQTFPGHFLPWNSNFDSTSFPDGFLPGFLVVFFSNSKYCTSASIS